jgi:hypothetical protein
MREHSFFPAPEPAPRGLSSRERADWDESQRSLDAERRAQVASRELAPHERSQWLAEMTAADRVTRTADALNGALGTRNRLLAAWDNISRPDLGLGPGLDDGTATLGDYERAAERSRRERIR